MTDSSSPGPEGLDDLREAIARALYEHHNRGLKNVWGWRQDGMEAEHPGVVERYERQANAVLRGPLATLTADLAALRERVERAEGENAVLRATLGNGPGPCPYCTLPKERWAECASGFPGCGRADDAMLCPHVGEAMEADAALAACRAENEGLRARVETVLADATRMSAILLMAGEMTVQERRTARAVARGIAARVRAALAPAPGGDGDA